MTVTLSDSERGTRVDFEEYVRSRRGALFGFAVVLTADPVLAEDLVSDVLGVAFERWTQVSAADHVHAYVKRMVVNEFLSWRRRRARTSPWAVPPEPALAEVNVDADSDDLIAELRALPPRQRAALVLRYYEGMSFEEIAALLGTGENAVRSNVSRALARLRITLAGSDAEHADSHISSSTPEALR